jgi:hypothetical protein
MIALLRYQTAILFRSHRWVFPLIVYVLLVSVGAAHGAGIAAMGASQKLAHARQQLVQGLDWSAAMLVPVVALLTRSMLTAEPPASRACVAVATGPARAQFAALLTALAGGAVLALAGMGYGVATSGNVPLLAAKGALLPAIGTGLGSAFVCLLVGSAVGTLFNAPVIRHPTVALLSTIAAVVVALVSNVSPANAALRGNGATMQSASWPTGVPVLAGLCLVVITWTLSAVLAAVRGE